MNRDNEKNDTDISLEELKSKIREFINARDWAKYHKPKDIAVSIAIETGELLKIFQWISDEDIQIALKDVEKLNSVKEELSDIIIYCLSLANIIDMNVADSIIKKIERNEEKYPVNKIKGNYKKYTEI